MGKLGHFLDVPIPFKQNQNPFRYTLLVIPSLKVPKPSKKNESGDI